MGQRSNRSGTAKPIPGKLGRLLLLSVAVGAIAGVGAIGFFWLMESTQHLLLDVLCGFRPEGPARETRLFAHSETPFRPWLLLFMPAIGGLVGGWIVQKFAPEAAGHGTDAAIESYHHRDGLVRGRVPLVKAVASAITIGSGGSGGREGPIAQIGAGFGSMLAKWLGLSGAERRTLMAAGMSAGIGAIFHAPLAGALFAAEVLYKDMDFEHEVLVPAFVSSIVAYSVFSLMFGYDPLFRTPGFVFDDPMQLFPYLVLAVALAIGAVFYIRVFYFAHHAFAAWKIPAFVKPAVGGLGVGAIGFFLPQALGTGYGILQRGFDGDGAGLTAGFLLLVALGKIATTALSIGSGGSGGVFGPAVVIGGCIGGAVGILARDAFPWMGIEVGAFVVVGMAGFFAAAANCPISTIIMVGEMTGNYRLLVPSMLVCIVGFVLARRHSLYEKQLESRLEAPSKMGNMLEAVLRKIPVREAARNRPGELTSIPEGMPLPEILRRFAESDQGCFPVVDPRGRLVGALDGLDLRRVIHEAEVADLIVARDMAKPAVTVALEDSLLDAVYKMTSFDANELVIVDPSDPTIAVATLNRSSVVRAYDKALFSART